MNPSLIANSKLFAGLDGEGLGEVARAAHVTHVAAGETLFEQGDEAVAFYVLLTGRVKIAQVTAEGHQVIIRYIAPGEVFGAVPLFINTGYPAAAAAVVDSTAARWDQAATRSLMERHPRITANALAIVGVRLQHLHDRYRELATERVEQRVARAILRLSQKAGQRVEEGAQIEFPVTRQDIAEMTGATLFTVSRVMSAWDQKGVTESGRQHVIVHDAHALVRIAEDLAEPPPEEG